MEELTIGKTRIPVTVKRNERLKKSRLSVDPRGVLVEVPNEIPEARLVAFVEQQKEWVYSQWEEVRGKRFQNAWPENFDNGAKVLFLGRMNPIEIKLNNENRVQYGVRGFQIETFDLQTNETTKALLIAFFQDYIRQVIAELTELNPALHAAQTAKIRFTQRIDRWAYCDETDVLHIGWDLAFLPKKLIEYVLLHEFCHLIHRNHSDQFWSALGALLPDYKERKKSLTEFEAQIEF